MRVFEKIYKCLFAGAAPRPAGRGLFEKIYKCLFAGAAPRPAGRPRPAVGRRAREKLLKTDIWYSWSEVT